MIIGRLLAVWLLLAPSAVFAEQANEFMSFDLGESDSYDEHEPVGEIFGYPVHQYVIGTRISWGPEYPGAVRSEAGIREVAAFDIGALRISTGGGGGLLRINDPDSGRSPSSASLSLFEQSRYRISLGLRMDSGRVSSDSGELAGLPDIRRTILARISAKFQLPGDWRGQIKLTSDILGKDSGRELAFSLGRTWPISARTKMGIGFGLTLGDGRHMRSWFGVPAQSPAAARLGVYSLGSGAKDLSAGVSWTMELDKSWVVSAGLSASALLSGAARSPFVKRRVGPGLSVGLAYRCC